MTFYTKELSNSCYVTVTPYDVDVEFCCIGTLTIDNRGNGSHKNANCVANTPWYDLWNPVTSP